jgi:hypothetical protein
MADGTVVDLTNQRKVIDELHSYCRHTMQLWVQWFTFFLTVNYVALGLFAGEVSKKELHDPAPLVYVAGLFISQNLLGIVISAVAYRHFSNMGHSLESGYHVLGLIPPQFAHKFYALAVAIGAVAMALVAGCWFTFAIRYA